MTVRVNDVVGVAGFALPGNFVDVLVNTQEDGVRNASARDASISKIVLERILVLAIAQEAGRDETKPKVVNAVTLELTPQQAERLDLARSVGTLSLVLRNQADPDPVRTGGATKANLLGTPVAAVVVAVAPAAPAPRQRPRAVAPVERSDQIEVIRGMDRGMQQF
jgi:pilus assembly protein CpaB